MGYASGRTPARQVFWEFRNHRFFVAQVLLICTICFIDLEEQKNRARVLFIPDLKVGVFVTLRAPDVIKRMVYAVMGEVHRMKAFVRLSSLGTSVLYGFFKPRRKIGEHICDHFARRNAGIIVVLGNGRESWISIFREGRVRWDHGQELSKSLERLKSALHCGEDGYNVEDLWQVYYDSQYCPERKNLAAFLRHMPRRDQEAAGLRLVQNKKNATLEDFLGEG
jgi:probable DNA metabolism protein